MNHRVHATIVALCVILILAWPAIASADPSPRPRHATHVVQPGETLSKIAAQHGVTLAALIRANGITNPDRIFVGAVLTIPEPSGEAVAQPQRPPVANSAATPLPTGRCTSPYIVRPGETLYGIARQRGLSIGALASANGLSTRAIIYVGQRLIIPAQDGHEASRPATSTVQPVVTPAAPASGRVCTDPYQVRSGDFLSSIARLCGVTVADLRQWNNLHSDIIYPGQWLRTRLSWSPLTPWDSLTTLADRVPELTPEPSLAASLPPAGPALPTPTPRIDPPLGD
jgi:LysM repeat protein